MRKYSTSVSILSYGTSLNRGLTIIEKFKKVNGIDFELEIKLDFDDPNLGYLWYSDQKKVKVIYINPLRCTNLKKNNLYGYPKDNSICSTISHEFGHFLDLKLKLLEPYNTEEFTNKKLILTKYAREDLKEELADLIAVYLINPYCIKLLDKERYDWLRTKFKSPSPCGLKTFMNYYNVWPGTKQRWFCDTYNLKLSKDVIVPK